MKVLGIVFIAISLFSVELHAAGADSQRSKQLESALASAEKVLPKGWKRIRTEFDTMPPGSLGGTPIGVSAVFQGTKKVVVGKVSSNGGEPRDDVANERVTIWIMPSSFKGRRVNDLDRLVRFPGLIETQPDRIGSNETLKVYGLGPSGDSLSGTSWPAWRDNLVQALKLKP